MIFNGFGPILFLLPSRNSPASGGIPHKSLQQDRCGKYSSPPYVAVMLRRPVIDGDAAGGRAKTSLIISTTHLSGIIVALIAISTSRTPWVQRSHRAIQGRENLPSSCYGYQEEWWPPPDPFRREKNSACDSPLLVSLAIQAEKPFREEKTSCGSIDWGNKRAKTVRRVESFSREEETRLGWDIL